MHAFNDAQQALGFVTSQLYRINATVYAQQYPDYDFSRLMFVDTTGPEWGAGVTTFTTNVVGVAKWQSGLAKDVPKADVTRGKIDKSFELAAVGYGWSLEEVNQASLLGIPLSAQKAAAARQAYMQFMYGVATVGDTEKNLNGMINYTGVAAGNVALGAASSRLWAQKTPAEILADINTVLLGIYTGTAYVEMADTLALPVSGLTYIGQVQLPNTSMTLLQFIRENNVYTQLTGQPLKIIALRDLETAGASGTRRMVAYKNDPTVVKLHMPMTHRFLPVYQDGPMSFEVPGIFRTGGVEVLRPGAFRYQDGF